MQLAPLVILVWELFRLGLDVMEPFLAPIPLVWQGRKKNCYCADIWSSPQRLVWFLSLLVSSEDCYASKCEIFSMFSHDFVYGMPLRRSGVGLSRRALVLSSQQLASDSAQNMMKPTAPKVVRNMSGASIPSDRLRRGDCVNFFLLGWWCDFDVVCDLVNTRHCSCYDVHAGIEH